MTQIKKGDPVWWDVSGPFGKGGLLYACHVVRFNDQTAMIRVSGGPFPSSKTTNWSEVDAIQVRYRRARKPFPIDGVIRQVAPGDNTQSTIYLRVPRERIGPRPARS